MHPSTEDLLTLRDGGAADADTLARLRAAPGAAHAVARLERLRDALRALPGLDPPAGRWEAIEARLAAPPPSAKRGSARGDFAAHVFGSAAALVLAVIAVLAATTTLPPGNAPDLRARSYGAADDGELLGDSPRAADTRLESVVERPLADGGIAQSYAPLQQVSDGGGDIESTERTLRELEAELEQLLRRYSDKHPRAVALERLIEAMRARLAALRADENPAPRPAPAPPPQQQQQGPPQ